MYLQLRSRNRVFCYGGYGGVKHFNQKVEKDFPFSDFDPEGVGEPDFGTFCARCKDRPVAVYLADIWTPGTSWFLRQPYDNMTACPYWQTRELSKCRAVQVQLIYVWIREKNTECETAWEPFKVLVEPCPDFFRGYGHVETYCEREAPLDARGNYFQAWWSKLYTASYADIVEEQAEQKGYADQHPWAHDRQHRGYQKWWWDAENFDKFPPPAYTPDPMIVEGCAMVRMVYRMDVSTDGCHAQWVFERKGVHELGGCEEELEDCWQSSVGPQFSPGRSLISLDGVTRSAFGCWFPVEYPICSSRPGDCEDPDDCDVIDCLAFPARTHALWLNDGSGWVNDYALLRVADEDDNLTEEYRCNPGDTPVLECMRKSAAIVSTEHSCDMTEPALPVTTNYWQKTITYIATLIDPCEFKFVKESENCVRQLAPIATCDITYRRIAGVWYAVVAGATVEFEHNSCIGPFPECEDIPDSDCTPKLHVFTRAIWERESYTETYNLRDQHLVVEPNSSRDIVRTCEGTKEVVYVDEISEEVSETICNSTAPPLPDFETQFIACMQRFTLRETETYIGWNKPGSTPEVIITQQPEDYSYISPSFQCVVQYNTEETDVEECDDLPDKDCEEYGGTLCKFDAYTHIIKKYINGAWVTDTQVVVRGSHPDQEDYYCDPDDSSIQVGEKYIQHEAADEHEVRDWTPTLQTERVHVSKVSLYEGVWTDSCHWEWQLRDDYTYEGRHYPYCIQVGETTGDSEWERFGWGTDIMFLAMMAKSVEVEIPICGTYEDCELLRDAPPTWQIEMYTVSVWERDISELTWTSRPTENQLVIGQRESVHVSYACEDGTTEVATVSGRHTYGLSHTCNPEPPPDPVTDRYVGCSKRFSIVEDGKCKLRWLPVDDLPPTKTVSDTGISEEVLQPDGTLVKTWGFEPYAVNACTGSSAPDPSCISGTIPYPDTTFSAYTVKIYRWYESELLTGWQEYDAYLVQGENITEEHVDLCHGVQPERYIEQVIEGQSTVSNIFNGCSSLGPYDTDEVTHKYARRQRYEGVLDDCSYVFELVNDECVKISVDENQGVISDNIPTSGVAASGIYQVVSSGSVDIIIPECFASGYEPDCTGWVMPQINAYTMHTRSWWEYNGTGYDLDTQLLFWGSIPGELSEPQRHCDGGIEHVQTGQNEQSSRTHSCFSLAPIPPTGTTMYIACVAKYRRVDVQESYPGGIGIRETLFLLDRVDTVTSLSEIPDYSYADMCQIGFNRDTYESAPCDEGAIPEHDCTNPPALTACQYHGYSETTWRRRKCETTWEFWHATIRINDTWPSDGLANMYESGEYVYAVMKRHTEYTNHHYLYLLDPPDVELRPGYYTRCTRITTRRVTDNWYEQIYGCYTCGYNQQSHTCWNYDSKGPGSVGYQRACFRAIIIVGREITESRTKWVQGTSCPAGTTKGETKRLPIYCPVDTEIVETISETTFSEISGVPAGYHLTGELGARCQGYTCP